MILTFDWDQWNIQKNEIKHGVSRLEAESIFFDNSFVVFYDTAHSSHKEKRWIGYGSSFRNRVLMTAFTLRRNNVRIISARPASKKERKIYEENKRDN